MIKKSVCLALFLLLLNCQSQSNYLPEQLGIAVDSAANRPVSFTNKKAAYYYTQTHINNHTEHAWFEGLNIAKKRVFNGYRLWLKGSQMDSRTAQVTVWPHKMERVYPNGLRETLHLFDGLNAVAIELDNCPEFIELQLRGLNGHSSDAAKKTVVFSALEGNWKVVVGSRNGSPVGLTGNRISVHEDCGGFLIAVDSSAAAALQLLDNVRQRYDALQKQRLRRMHDLLAGPAFIASDDDTLQLALRWMLLNMDQLVTKQQGRGIYAGLPWFNEYWGRDEFIALPGACLVSGQFETAREILLSFARFQNRDRASKFFGRVPNIVNPENIDYHTTDGTPRFVIQLQQYVQYSGDTSLVHTLYPVVKNSIEGALQNWVDARGYLRHADNETWMDARRAEDLKPYSPRGTRANDIQALWYGQLRAGTWFARLVEDTLTADKWQKVAENVRQHFEQDFRDAQYDFLADRLDERDQAEFKLRPNQLFAFDMLADNNFKWRATRRVWEELVYPWGVASLNRQDPFFHPYHLSWQHYHKDEAYHNGTVWLWNNGIAMQRMIEAGQQATAWKLFMNMNRLALSRGVVGGLAENSDAYPHPGKKEPLLTGTYLQAWSLSEQLRVWYQYFLGIRPQLISGTLKLIPRLPDTVKRVDGRVRIGQGIVKFAFRQGHLTYRFNNLNLKLHVDVNPFPLFAGQIRDGDLLEVLTGDSLLRVILNGELLQKLRPDHWRLDVQSVQSAIFKGTQFCFPLSEQAHPVLQQVYKR